MSILSDGGIRARLKAGSLCVEPLDDALIQPASIDFRLHPNLLVFNNHTCDAIDPYDVPADLHTTVTMTETQPFVMHPGEFVLGSTVEVVTIPDDLVARCEGKSSLARLGLLIHITAGFVDPGFRGAVTLELSNVSRLPIRLWPNMKIGQFSFETLDAPAERPYGHPDLGSKYQGQNGPQASLYSLNERG